MYRFGLNQVQELLFRSTALTSAGSPQTLNRAIIHSVTKSTEAEKLGNGKWNVIFLFSEDFKRGGVRESESSKLVLGGRVAGGEDSGTFGVLVTEAGGSREEGSKAGLDPAQGPLVNI